MSRMHNVLPRFRDKSKPTTPSRVYYSDSDDGEIMTPLLHRECYTSDSEDDEKSLPPKHPTKSSTRDNSASLPLTLSPVPSTRASISSNHRKISSSQSAKDPTAISPPTSPAPTKKARSTKAQSTKHPRPTDTFVDEDSDDDDVLNENVSAERKVKAMEKAQRILSKYKTENYCKTNPTTKSSWLM